jgi:hypothetical protein
MAALRQASAATGVDFRYLVKTAQRESNFDPTAKARTSSATGLFQFTNETWLNMLDRYGARNGVATGGTREARLALREDAGLSALMAGELANENARILEGKLGRPPTTPELYAAHFMGPSDAARLIEAARSGEAGAAASLFPRAALANANVFRGADGEALTPAELYVKLTGETIEQADGGGPVGAPLPSVSEPGVIEPNVGAQGHAILAARLGVAQLTSGLMAALFEWQDRDDRG